VSAANPVESYTLKCIDYKKPALTRTHVGENPASSGKPRGDGRRKNLVSLALLVRWDITAGKTQRVLRTQQR